MIKLAVEDGGAGSVIDATYATNSATIQGHPGAAGAAAVGAAAFYSTPSCGTSPAQLESFSSLGGAPILFNTSGAAITSETRQKPDFVGPDGVNNTFLGFTLAGSGFTDTSSVSECADDAGYPNFFGTSAATPHAAGVAALMLQANPAVTPAQIYTNLQSSAAAMGTSANPNRRYVQLQRGLRVHPGASGDGAGAGRTDRDHRQAEHARPGRLEHTVVARLRRQLVHSLGELERRADDQRNAGPDADRDR
jgi:subtilisin family serine protease